MSATGQDEAEKSHEPTPQKLQKAREKGEVAKSADVSVAAAYAGFLLTALAVGPGQVRDLGTTLMGLLDRAETLSALLLEGPAFAPAGGVILAVTAAVLPWFIIPAAFVLLSILAQRAFVVAPSKIKPKLSRISIVSNAKNKFGRSGLFEFAKSFIKLLLYSVCLGLFLKIRLVDMVMTADTSAMSVVATLGRFCVEFLFLVLLVATGLGVVDAVWQHQEHLRKNRMSRKELMDETKEAEGDPQLKQQRRAKAQQIAHGQMMADVPSADVVIVNPTHFAVALQWNRTPGSAPKCVAKGVDEVAHAIRRVAVENGVPVHSDPPTARALHSTVEIGEEIPEEHYRTVAAAIRFAEDMRAKARGKPW